MNDITFISHRKALIDLCLRNAMRYAVGEIKYSHDVHIQLQYAYRESNETTRELLRSVFANNKYIGDLD